MSKFTSNPTTLIVYKVGPVSLGSGSDPGLYSNGVWTPGRDANGVANQVSYNLVPRGQWVRVAGSEMSQLDSAVKAALPGWRDTNGWQELVRNSWSGLCMDWWNGSRMWWLGGGHRASTNNGLYRFDHAKLQWAIECLPTNPADPTVWDPGYDGGGPMPSVLAATMAKFNAGTLQKENDIYSDEWGGKPASRHTYGWMVYAPNLNRILMGGRRFWSFNLSTGSWDYKRQMADAPFNLADINNAGTGAVDIEHGSTFWDEKSNEYLYASYGSTGIPGAGKFQWNTKTWAAFGSPFTTWNVCDTRVGRNFVQMSAGIGAGSPYPQTPQYSVYNLDSNTATTKQVQYGSSVVQADFGAIDQNATFFDNPALCYVPPINRYWYWTAVQGNQIGFFEIDPTTTPWTIHRKTFTGDVPSPYIVLGRKLMWSAALNAVLFINDGSTPMYLYRF